MSPDPDDIEPVRVTKLFGDIVSLRLAYNLQGDGDEGIFQRYYGAEGSFLFWSNFLHGVVSITTFVQHVTQARSECWDRIDVTQMAIQKALLEAYQADGTFFRGDLSKLDRIKYFREIEKPELIKVIGRKAAEWLLASPRWKHLVPNTLAAFLRGEKPRSHITEQTDKAVPRTKRGPKSDLTKRAADKILADLRSGVVTLKEFAGEKQDSIASRYGVKSRSTAKLALGIAEKQFVEEFKLRQIAAIDK